MSMRDLLIVGLLGLTVSCGGDDDGSAQPSREDLIDVLKDEKTAAQSHENAECTADKMLELGITQAQLDELREYDGTGDEPNGLAIYRDARDECVATFEGTGERIN